MTDPEDIDPKDIRPGPIRHESLSADLLHHIAAVYDVIGPYLGTTLEQFEITFMRDMHPESEVVLWCSITAAWIAYHEQYLDDETLPDEEEKKLLAALIAISTGVDDAESSACQSKSGEDFLSATMTWGKSEDCQEFWGVAHPFRFAISLIFSGRERPWLPNPLFLRESLGGTVRRDRMPQWRIPSVCMPSPIRSWLTAQHPGRPQTWIRGSARHYPNQPPLDH